jgi:ABC-2 type transport system permease protein
MNANVPALVPRRTRGWRMGLVNMLAKENIAWWRTRRWWVQCLLWVVLLNGAAFEVNILGDMSVQSAMVSFFMMAALGLSISAISMAQDAILGEKHSGTAAWVLSKPLRRPAYLLSKLLSYSLGFLVTGIIVPAFVLYFQLSLHGYRSLTPLGVAGAMSLVYLNLFFYLTLAFMLAALFNGRGPILGITIGLLLTGLFFGLMPPVKLTTFLMIFMPWRLLFPFGAWNPLAANLFVGAPLPVVSPIIATVLWCLLFTGLAIWRIRREEF